MISPRLFDIPTFDAGVDTAVQFEWNGAQLFANKLTIKDNETGVDVYSEVYEYMGKAHIIPANTLENGKCYNAFVEVLNYQDEDPNDEDPPKLVRIPSSDVSNTVIFYCYTNPVLTPSTEGLVGGTLPISTFTAIFNYSQNEHDLLSQYQIVLYDANKSIIYNPGVKYLTEWNDSISQAFSGLENNKNYFVRATGKTAHDVFVDSDFFAFNVRYENPEIFSRLDLVNNSKYGNISITSNLISIIGTLDGDGEPIYINNKMIDLRNGKVTFADGYRFKENWTIGASMCAITPNIPLITWQDENGKQATVVYREDVFVINNDALKGYFELIVDGPGPTSGDPYWHVIIDSNFIDPIESEEDKYTVWIVKRDGYYYLSAVQEEDAVLSEGG